MQRRQFLKAGALSAAAVVAPRAYAAGPPGRIRVGQVGVGHAHAGGKLETLLNHPEVFELVGVCEPDESLRSAFGKKDKFANVRWVSEEELLNTKGLAAVLVETEVKDLLPTAARCISAGLHIHLDKPAGESLAQFAAILREAGSRGRTVQMGYMLRYNPAFELCFRAVREGWLGRVFELHGVMSKKLDQPGRNELVPYRGGAMFELGCHLIDAVVTVLGAPTRVTPFGRALHDDSLLDNQLAVFEYPHATATVRASVVEPRGTERRQFVVCGEEGSIAIQPLEPPAVKLVLESHHAEFKAGSQDVSLPRRKGRYDADLLDLAAVIRGEKSLGWTIEHDLAVQTAVLQASGMLRQPPPQAARTP